VLVPEAGAEATELDVEGERLRVELRVVVEAPPRGN
jgi:hypothetical protein